MNSVNLVGNLTRDVDVQYGQSGTAFTTLGLAVNERVKKGDQYVDEPVFVDVKLFGRQAELASEYCQKGSKVGVSGRLKLDQWESDGQKRSKLSVVSFNVEFLSPKGDKPAGKPEKPQGQSQSPPDDDIPF